MSTTTQTHYNAFAAYNNANNHSQFAAQSQRFSANSFSARGPSEPMSRMRGNFSQTSFSMTSHNSPHGSSSTITAQSTSIGRGYDQPPAPGYHRGESYSQSNMAISSRSVKNSRDFDRAPPRNDWGRSSAGDSAQWNVTKADGKQATIQVPGWTLGFEKGKSLVSLTNNATGDKTQFEGDPHVYQHANSAGQKTSAMFNRDLKIATKDGTKFIVHTQADKNNPKVSYVSGLDIVRDNQSLSVKGINQQDNAPLTVQKGHNGRQLDAASQGAYLLEAARDGRGIIDPTTHKNPTQSDFNKHAA
jgi:hypothetical protein